MVGRGGLPAFAEVSKVCRIFYHISPTNLLPFIFHYLPLYLMPASKASERSLPKKILLSYTFSKKYCQINNRKPAHLTNVKNI